MSADELMISVVLPTHNRGELLRKAIQSLIDQSLPAARYEVLIVDNASTDGTKQVVETFARRHNVRYLHEPRLGAARARNTGWQGAKGALVAFVDDDVVVPRNWLASIARAFERADRAPACVGGPVRPIWEAERPSWFHDELLWPLAIIEWGKEKKDLTDTAREWLVSANMAVSRSVLEELGGFHVRLDKVGKRDLVNGETHLQRRLLRAGYRCAYDPDIAVSHHVPASRLTKKWFLRRYYFQGVSDFAVDWIDKRMGILERLYLAAGMSARVLGAKRHRSLLFSDFDDPELFKEKCYLVVKLGYIAGLLGALRR